MTDYDSDMTEIVQIPEIRRNGVTIMRNTDIMHLSDSELQTIAKTVKGVVVYPKVRASYTLVEGTPMCAHYGCFKLGKDGIDDCGEHTQGR